MFGFGKRKLSPSSSPRGVHCFGVKTRIAKSVGKHDKYKCGSVRALPSINKDEVVLQVTDGHHATCLLTNGQMTTPRLVPASVLPTKQHAKAVGVRLLDGQWESLEGRIVIDTDGGDEAVFPKIGDVLPIVSKTPFHETPMQAERRKGADPALSMHVVLGIDLELLRKAAESLGTMKLTLFVPVPVKDASKKACDVFVDKPVAVCPALRDNESKGVAVVMPLAPENGLAYYTKVREVVVASEQRALKTTPARPVPSPVQPAQRPVQDPVQPVQSAVRKAG